jgi:hypothetical protein
MDDDKDLNFQVPPEEQKVEEEAQKEVKDEELRAKVAEDFGINPEENPELLNRLVEREKAHHERLSGAIKQKINWRTKAQTSGKPGDGKGKTQDNGGKTDVLTEEAINKLLDERLAERDLKELGLPEDIETEVKDLSKLKGISVKEAAKLPYIASRLKEIEEKKKLDSASPKRGGKGSYKVSDLDLSKPLNPEDFDLSTEEGRKAWKEAREARDRHISETSSK